MSDNGSVALPNRQPDSKPLFPQERAAKTIRMTAAFRFAQLASMQTAIRQRDTSHGRARLGLTLAAALAMASLANVLCLCAFI